MEETMTRIHETVKQASLRARGQSVTRRRKRDLVRPSAKWTAPARVGRDKGTALAIVLSTIGCAHARSDSGGCTMCSYLLDGSQEMPTSDQLVEQFKTAMMDLVGKEEPLSVKIYTSGSFLDPVEIPVEARSAILEILGSDDRVRGRVRIPSGICPRLSPH